MGASRLGRTALPALLPVLLFVLLALVAEPQRATAAPRAAATGTAAPAEAAPEQSGSVAESAVDAAPAPADRAAVLLTQFTVGVRGSRAPPATSA
jgi:hypothetical protein